MPVTGATVEALICSYSWSCDEAVAVARCESGLRAGAVSPDGANYGLFQVNRVHAYRVGGNVYALLDAETNVATAFAIYRDAGYSWSPWSCKP
jgi:soluble lytic murein transglycosylase-like protein